MYKTYVFNSLKIGELEFIWDSEFSLPTQAGISDFFDNPNRLNKVSTVSSDSAKQKVNIPKYTPQ